MEAEIAFKYGKKHTPSELKLEDFPPKALETPNYSPEPDFSSYSSSYKENRMSNTSSTGPKTPDSDTKMELWDYATDDDHQAEQSLGYPPSNFTKNSELGLECELNKLTLSVDSVAAPKFDLQILSSPTSPTSAPITDPFEDEEEILAQPYLTEEQKAEKLTQILRRVASNGDSKRLKKLLSIARTYVDIDGQDEDGTTPLIYSACWGYLEVAYTLLEAGADPNAQDKSGWTALMWATNNHHDGIVATLIDHGASTTSKSSKGRTVMDFVNHGMDSDHFQNQRIVEILTDPRDGAGSTGSNRESGYYTSSKADLESVISESDILYKMALDQAKGSDLDLSDFRFSDYGDFEDEAEFSWDNIQPDQMFVFTHDNLGFLLEKVIVNMKPSYSREHKFIPANVLFLAARYGVLLGGPDLLETLMNQSFDKILEVVQQHRQDMSVLAFWLSNCTLLLYYLKRDVSLVTASVEFQLGLSELIHELYQSFVRNVTQRIEEVLEPAMLVHDAFPGMEDIKFVGEKRNFLFPGKKAFTPPPSPRTSRFSVRRKSRFSIPVGTSRAKPATPKTVACILSSTLIVLQSFEVHPTIIHYALNQIFYYISAEMFNRVMITKDYCCRAKAMQIRMNISSIEDWVHSNRLPQVLIQHFNSLIQLLQLLQCISGLSDLTELLVTIKELSGLNVLQTYRIAHNYRYEVGENQLPEEITQYLEQVAKDTCNVQAHSSSETDKEGHRKPKVREENIDILPTYEHNQPAAASAQSEDMEELMDPTHLLPFAIPTSSEMLSGWGRSEKEYVPYLPESFFTELDEELRQRFGV
ncbi:hypothetical protein K493DRAFT_278981 [Basidiobolus meristosporus CBS 931.73]|uniref:Dilute domain-containing protein n=1 Tax=Basidiobolus meristosporus CBS 931.73 TaxID=1314790 RepID=A0A1Y1YQA5_9FUNG|nr:hypothetical protein K493DRAFT_278981 [Basidiobolus meristosporus CBS 931.73]|eukprot:ORY00212.1 hypothetical protein K493DRAFT_278981 [Basidiobolus meristosporus CBS 931.73]